MRCALWAKAQGKGSRAKSLCSFLFHLNFGIPHKIVLIKRCSSRHDRPISKSEVRQYFKEGNRASGWDATKNSFFLARINAAISN